MQRGLATLLASYTAAKLRPKLFNRSLLHTWQQHRIKRLIQYATARSPYHQERLAHGWPPQPIAKTEMMDHFDNYNTLGLKRSDALAVALQSETDRDFSPMLGSVTVGLSSGTSGHRGLFLVSPQERFAWAGAILARTLPKPIWHHQRIALFLRANSNLYGTIASQRIQFEYYDLLQPLDHHIQRLIRYAPTVLVAPPSVLRLLVEAGLPQQLAVLPQKIISVAEVLDPIDEVIIRQGFYQQVHQIYQCTEGFLAATCQFGTLHLNEDLVYFEREKIADQPGKFIPIITDLSRTTQPLIRYRLNDILTERPDACPCHSPFLALSAIEGRCDDIFYFPALHQDPLIPVLPDFIRRAILLATSDIQGYRVRQISLSELEIELQLSSMNMDAAQTQIHAQLVTLCLRLGAHVPSLRFVPYNTMQQGTQKLRRVTRSFALNTSLK